MYEYDPELATQLILLLMASAAFVTAAAVAVDAIRRLRGR